MQKIPVMGCGDGIVRAQNGGLTSYPALALTANRTLTRFDAGKMVTNTGATGTVVATLPAPIFGWWIMAVVTTAQILTFTAPAGIRINNSATGGTFSAAGTQALSGNSIIFSDGINYYVSPGSGTWTTT